MRKTLSRGLRSLRDWPRDSVCRFARALLNCPAMRRLPPLCALLVLSADALVPLHAQPAAGELRTPGNARGAAGDVNGGKVASPRSASPPTLPLPAVEQLFHRAVQLQNQRDFKGAIAALDQAILLQGSIPVLYVNRGACRRALNDEAGAMADYNRALELNPRFAPALVNRGNLRLGQGAFVEAIADLDRATELDPRNAHAFRLRGEARISHGDPAGAIADYNHALTLNPGFTEARLNRDTALQLQGDWDALIEVQNRAIAANPRSAEAHAQRAAARRRKGDWTGAIADFTRANDLQATRTGGSETARPPHALDVAAAHVALGDPEEATKIFERERERTPKGPLVNIGLGHARRVAGDWAGALAAFDRAIAVTPKNAEANAGRGLVFWSKPDWREALTCLNRASELDPHGQIRSELLAWVLRTRQGEREVADRRLAAHLAWREKNPTRPNVRIEGHGALAVFLRSGSDVEGAAWFATVAAFLLGRTDEAEFLAAADAHTRHHFEAAGDAAFYAACKRLLAGERRQAEELFRQCVSRKGYRSPEFSLAQIELERLGRGE